jgi:hypothetical protein
MRIPSLAAASVALIIALASCGGSGKTTSSSTAAATTPASTPATTQPQTATAPNTAPPAVHVAFVRRIDPICAEYNRTIQAIQPELQKQGALAQSSGRLGPYVAPLSRALAAATAASRHYDAVHAPAAERPHAALIGRVLRGQARLDALLLAAARKNSPSEFSAVEGAIAKYSQEAQLYMRAYGMTQICGAAH